MEIYLKVTLEQPLEYASVSIKLQRKNLILWPVNVEATDEQGSKLAITVLQLVETQAPVSSPST